MDKRFINPIGTITCPKNKKILAWIPDRVIYISARLELARSQCPIRGYRKENKLSLAVIIGADQHLSFARLK
jgi:hypothetical protein